MAVSKEIIGEILNFRPDNKQTTIGRIDADTQLACGIFSFQQRVTSKEGESHRVLSWARQRVLALVGERRVTPLVYPADVEAVGTIVAEKIATHIRFLTNPVPESAGVNQEDW